MSALQKGWVNAEIGWIGKISNLLEQMKRDRMHFRKNTQNARIDPWLPLHHSYRSVSAATACIYRLPSGLRGFSKRNTRYKSCRNVSAEIAVTRTSDPYLMQRIANAGLSKALHASRNVSTSSVETCFARNPDFRFMADHCGLQLPPDSASGSKINPGNAGEHQPASVRSTGHIS
jgi:hypothetical protein